MKSRRARLAVAFWCSLIVTALTIIFAVRYGVEAGRASQRMIEAQDQGRRLEVEAANQISPAGDSSNAFADASARAQRLVDDARLERDRSQQSLFYSMIAVAVGFIATASAGRSWRQRVEV
jgi:hypothetical protein